MVQIMSDVTDYTLTFADPPVLGPGVMLRRDWHVQLDFVPKAGQPERLWVSVESVDGERCTGRLEQSGNAAGLPLSGDLLAFENRHVVNVQVIPQPAAP
jgi:hypothetical protein